MELNKWPREVLVLLGRMSDRQARGWEGITTRITQEIFMRKIIKYRHLHLYLLLKELHSQHWTEAQNTAGVSSGIRSDLPNRGPMAVLWRRPTAFVDIRIRVTHVLEGDKDLSLSYRKKLEYDSLSLCDITSHF